MSTSCYLSGFGSCLPPRILTNQEIEQRVDTTNQWIIDRTGIKSRHVMTDDQMPTDLATEAARKALVASGFAASEITHVVAATCSPEYLCPSTACIVSSKLGLEPVMAFDVNAACAGFLYGIDVVRGLVVTHPGAKILLIGVEGLSRRINWQDRGTCVLFADGAGAVVVTGLDVPRPADAALVEDSLCLSEGRHWQLLTVGGGTVKNYANGQAITDDFYIAMSGREVFKFAVRNMSQICRTMLERNGLGLEDIDLLVPHQANLRIIEAVNDRLKLDPAKVFINVDTHGNTSAASIPLALADARASGQLHAGMRVLLVSFGGGFTWAATLLKF